MSGSPDDSFSVRLNQAAQQSSSDSAASEQNLEGGPRKPIAPPQKQEATDSFSARLGDLESQAAEPTPEETPPPAETVQAEPCGAGSHTVSQQECLAEIAESNGHSWDTIWNDPANAQVRASREDPNLLLEGDRLHVPPLETKQEPGATEQRHRFVLSTAPANIALQLKDENGAPRGNLAYELKVGGETQTGHTDPTGFVRAIVPATASEATLTLVESGEVFPLKLGGLQTARGVAGVQGRLNNLGFHCGPVTGRWNEATRQALKMFQSKQGLRAHGHLDEQTLQRLRVEHSS